jgi:hypothetical protein
MSNKRIDLTQFKGISKGPWEKYIDAHGSIKIRCAKYDVVDQVGPEGYGVIEDDADAIAAVPELIPELKKMYKREDELLEALRIIRDDLDEAIAQGNLPITSTNGIDATKIRNFANDASQ